MQINKLPSYEEQVDRIIDLALAEDISQGDITSETLIPPELEGKATFIAKEEGIVAGLDAARRVFHKVDPSLSIKVFINDGTEVKPGDNIATVSGKVRSILKAERTALNFLQRLSGTASSTARYVAATRGAPVAIMDTRKTTPGIRALEKQAVHISGGKNHRLYLSDGILIKDNHLVALRSLGISLKDIVVKAKQNAPEGLMVEVEVTTIQEAREAAEGGADIIMLDNMELDQMRQVASLMPKSIKIEASGGITLDNVRQVAMTGVDFISIGALTHSVKSLNISLELEPPSPNR